MSGNLRLVAYEPPPPPPSIRIVRALVYDGEGNVTAAPPVERRLFAGDWATVTIPIDAYHLGSRRKQRRGKPVGSRTLRRVDIIDDRDKVVYTHPVDLELPDTCGAELHITMLCQPD